MSILGLFGSNKLAEKGADLLNKGFDIGDEAFYTDQEKAADLAKKNESWLRLSEMFIAEGSFFAIARRVLALTTAAYYFPMCIAAAAFFGASVFIAPTMPVFPDNVSVEKAVQIMNEFNPHDLHWRLIGGARYLRQMAVEQLPLVVSVFVFYFGPGIAEKMLSRKK